MKIFVSWSGPRSKSIAEALVIWLPHVIQSVEPWISTQNLGKGAKWSSDLSSELRSHAYGIICVTPENRGAPWLLFEAGALSKTEGSKAYTLLLGLSPAEVEQPLAQFNHTLAEESEMRSLVRDINESSTYPLSLDRLNHAFETNWPYLNERFADIIATDVTELPEVKRDERSILEELLQLAREQHATGVTLVSSVPGSNATPHMVQGVAEEILMELGIRAQIATRRDRFGNFNLRIFFVGGGSMGMEVSGASTAEDVATNLRKTFGGMKLRPIDGAKL